MYSFQQCQEVIDEELKKITRINYPEELYQPINYVLSIGGKRIRPGLLIMACNMYTEDITAAIYPALAIEVFHNFTLLHDDIMDNAVLRRNQPTVHIKWDTNVAILSGDAMMIRSYELLSLTPSEKLPELLKEFNKAALEVCEGQQYDMNYEKILDVSVDDYLNMIRLKTSVLIASAMKIGAMIGDASDKDQKLIYDLGLNLGIGFQLQDDLLDVFGNSLTFGKKIGGDIVANKKTFLLLTALTEAKGNVYHKLRKLITSHEVSREEKVEMVIDIYNQLDIKQKTNEKINLFFDKARQCLDQISVATARKEKIKEFVDILINRYV